MKGLRVGAFLDDETILTCRMQAFAAFPSCMQPTQTWCKDIMGMSANV